MAGGSASQGRIPETQAIYKLKGKPTNTHDKDLVQVDANKELKDLNTITGCGRGKDFDINKSKYHKYIITADADIDGCQIL